jgi:ketosteroid isomerase-like protein
MHLVVRDEKIVRMHLYEDTLTVERALAAGSPAS